MKVRQRVAAEREGKMSPEVAARVEEFAKRLFAAFSVLYSDKKAQKVKELSKAAGLSETYLHKVLNGTRALTMDVVLKVVAAAKDPLERLFRTCARLNPGNEGLDETLATLLGSPAELLEDWREKPEAKDPFLVEAEAWLEVIRSRGTEVRPAATPLRQVVLSLEEERLRDWRWSKQQLELRGRDHWQDLSKKERFPRSAIGDLSVLVAAWAAVQRVAGFRGNGIDALKVAFELAEIGDDSWAMGCCLQKAAYLAHDLGHDPEALVFVQRATLRFAEAPTVDDMARNTIDRGYFFFQLGNKREAERLLSAGVSKLGPQQTLYKFTAHQALSRIAHEQGQLDKARQEIKAAAEYCSGEGLEAAYLAWTAAGIEKEAGSYESAERYFREAILLFAKSGRAGDIAFIALELMALLIQMDRRSELAALATGVLGWLEPLASSNSCLLEVFENIVALMKLGTLTHQNVVNALKQARSMRESNTSGHQTARVSKPSTI
jgi:tetratricopeptide (TPR) repeat protein